MLEHPTSEKEFGLSEKIPNNLNFFHTPNTTGIDGGSNSRKALKKRLAETPSGNWPTPTCSDIYTGNLKSTQQKEGSMHSVTLPQAVRGAEQINNGQLNPMWVEWLMGWPIGWTDLKPLETDKCHYVQQPLGTS
jgi:DNA (cytosine-5)-methyltransferase 1